MKTNNGNQPQKSLITEEIIKTTLSRIKPVDGTPIALILPSGITQDTKVLYAAGFKQLEGTAIDHLILIGIKDPQDPDHSSYIQAQGHFKTLVGEVLVASDLAKSLAEALPDHVQAKNPETFDQFNPVLPFIKLVCPKARVLPVLLAPGDIESARKIGSTIAAILQDNSGGVIAFSNLDERTQSAMEYCDVNVFLHSIPKQQDRSQPGQIVSYAPLAAALQFAREMGSNIISILNDMPHYDPDTKTSKHQASIMLWKYLPPNFTPAQQAELISMAKNAIQSYITRREIPGYQTKDPAMLRKTGVFVTLRQKNMLRGCIGRMQADTPLYKAVQEMAIAAATSDPRFPPIRSEELDQLAFKIAVLSPLKRITAEEVEVGKHGLMISHQGRRGVLLPEVPVDRGWNREMFLSNLCMKASLPTRVLQENPALYAFTAVEFGS